jgi:hypothetical protein
VCVFARAAGGSERPTSCSRGDGGGPDGGVDPSSRVKETVHSKASRRCVREWCDGGNVT